MKGMTLEQRIITGPPNTNENHSVVIEHWVGPLTTPDGFTHVSGKHTVKAYHGLSGKAYQGRVYKGRAKTFKGETAWMNAERLFDDLVFEVRRGDN